MIYIGYWITRISEIVNSVRLSRLFKWYKGKGLNFQLAKLKTWSSLLEGPSPTYLWYVARFGASSTILKTWKTPMEKSYFLKVTLLHGYFSRFLNCANGTK